MEKELRKVKVRQGTLTFEGYFHGWSTNIEQTEDEREAIYKVAIIEDRNWKK